MTRLLHAAARGARIQALYDKWETEKFVTVLDLQDPRYYDYRIHPEDEHLQYGPISTALREMAKNPKVGQHAIPNLPPHFSFGVAHDSWIEVGAVRDCDDLTHSLFLLILAEALADEGL